MTEHESRTTTDHDTIRRWVEARGGLPASVRGTADQGEKAGILRIDFPGYGAGEESLRHISWEEFFDKFDASDLSFLYQEETKSGRPSRFFKFVSRTEH